MKKLFFLKYIILCFCFFYTIKTTKAQDVHFTQNYATPLFVNPAFAGVMPGDVRASVVYRNQWASVVPDNPFRTIYASADVAFNGFRQNDRFSTGIMFYNDKAGTVSLNTNFLNLALAYNVNVGNNSFASFGFTGGAAQRTLDVTNAQFGNQYNGYEYSQEVAPEVLATNRKILLTVGAGGMVFIAPKPNTNFWAGMGVYNLNGAKNSFLDNGRQKEMLKFSAHAGGSLAVSKTFNVVPSAYFLKQGKHAQVQAGALARFILFHDRRSGMEKAFNAGAFLRVANGLNGLFSPDAVSIVAKLDYNEFTVGVSYDITVSPLASANNNKGGAEIALTYQTKRMTTQRALNCPRF